MEFFEELWETAAHLRNLVERIHSFFYYPKKVMETDQNFIDNELSTFFNNIILLSEFQRTQ